MGENLEPNVELDTQTKLPHKTYTWNPPPERTAQVKPITPDDIFEYMLTKGLNPMHFTISLDDDFVYIIPKGYLGDTWKRVASLFVGEWISESLTEGYFKVPRQVVEFDIHFSKTKV